MNVRGEVKKNLAAMKDVYLRIKPFVEIKTDKEDKAVQVRGKTCGSGPSNPLSSPPLWGSGKRKPSVRGIIIRLSRSRMLLFMPNCQKKILAEGYLVCVFFLYRNWIYYFS